MWKPRVLPVRARPSLGGGAARFAAEIRARFGPPPDSQLYPEAWLVFREQEEREEEQAVSEIHLTQLTLRLALQLNEYFTAVHRDVWGKMEVQSLRETLHTCLTALESRDRETCREVRLLLSLSQQDKGAEEPRPANSQTMETVRERLVRRLTALERETARPTGAGTVTPLDSRPEGQGAKSPETAQRQPGRLLASPWRQAVLPTLGTPASRRQQAERQAQAALQEHKERFLQLLSRTEPREREELWHIAEEHTYLTVRRRQQWNEEYHLEASEKLERLVRESTGAEYTYLIQVLRQQLSRESSSGAEARPGDKAAVPQSAAAAPQPEQPEAAARGLLTQAAPMLDWLDRTLRQGRVRRTAMLAQLQAAPEPEQRAFLTLARESGVIRALRGQPEPSGGEAAAWEQLTLVTRESRRRELEELVQWTRAIPREEKAPGVQAAVPGPSASAGPTRTESPQRAQSATEPAPGQAVSALSKQESAGGRALRQFLTRGGPEDRQRLARMVAAARPGELDDLAAGRRKGTGEEAPTGSRWERTGETVLRLLEGSADPVRLLERVKAAQGVPGKETGGTARTEDDRAGFHPPADLEHRHLPSRGQTPSGTEPFQTAPRPNSAVSQQTQETAGRPRSQPDREQSPKTEPLLDRVIRWAEDRRRWERLELARTVLLSSRVEHAQREEHTHSLALSGTSGRGRRETASALSPYRRPELIPWQPWNEPPAGQSPTSGRPAADILAAVPLEVPGPFQRRQLGRPGEAAPQPTKQSQAQATRPPLAGRAGRKEGVPEQEPAPTESPAMWEPIPPWADTPRPELRFRPAMPPRRTVQPRQGMFPVRQTRFQSPAPARGAEQAAAPLYPDVEPVPLEERPIATGGPALYRGAPSPLNRRSLMPPPAVPTFLKENGPLGHPQAAPRTPARPGREDFSQPQAPQMELRREQGREAPKPGERSVEKQVELAMERQAPQLHLLRRQTQEQERALKEQRQDLGALKKRLEQQEAQVRRAVETARIPALEEPAQVRRLAKAVMKELEDQLRLERQRRGLS